MKCPKCGSDNTQRLQVVYEQGTQLIRTSSSTVGTGFNSSALGLGGAQTLTTGTAQSSTAKKAAPPPKQPAIYALGISAIGLLCLAAGWWMKLAGLALIGGGVYLFNRMRAYNRDTWPALHARWESSWLCNKCGTIYEQRLD